MYFEKNVFFNLGENKQAMGGLVKSLLYLLAQMDAVAMFPHASSQTSTIVISTPSIVTLEWVILTIKQLLLLVSKFLQKLYLWQKFKLPLYSNIVNNNYNNNKTFSSKRTHCFGMNIMSMYIEKKKKKLQYPLSQVLVLLYTHNLCHVH